MCWTPDSEYEGSSDERQWLSAGYAWHSRPRTTTLSSNLRNAGAMSQDERRLFPVRRDLEHLTSKLPREPRDDPPRSLLAECSARYSFCLEESTAAMIFHEFLAPSARRVSHLCQRVDRTLERRVQRFRIQTAAAMITRHTNMSNARACFSLWPAVGPSVRQQMAKTWSASRHTI